jgi:AcrR family transcriptional regulator
MVMSPRTRNEVEYEATLEQIKEVARQQMAAEGTAALSLRAIAREMDITAPALYRYYASRDELITALIVDAYNAQADAMAEANEDIAREDYSGRLLAILLAYRQWAMEHPTDFQLIYGNPIPRYEAPMEVTLPVARRGFEIVVGIIAEAIAVGTFTLKTYDIPPTVVTYLASMVEYEGYDVALDVLYVATVGWAKVHGLVSLELFNHTQPVVGDTEAFYRYEVVRFIRDNGIWHEP